MTPNLILDTSWTIYSLESLRLPTLLQSYLRDSLSQNTLDQLHDLSQDLQEHIRQNGRALKDDFDGEAEKIGQLRECQWTIVPSTSSESHSSSDDRPLGFLIETRYSKTTYRILLVVIGHASHATDSSTASIQTANANTDDLRLVRILAKSPASNFKHVVRFLQHSHGLAIEEPVKQHRLQPHDLLTACAQYLDCLDRADESQILRQALIKQAIGTVKLNIAISAPEVAAKLKTIDIDVPADTIIALLAEAQRTGSTFLTELGKHIHSRTGLRLPIDVHSAAVTTEDPALPWHISKITCSAFALSVDGKMKLGSKPIGSADVLGVNHDVLRRAACKVFDVIYKADEEQNHVPG